MSIVRKVINNATYIYDVKSFRDKKTKKVKTKWTYIGRLNENGSIITKKRKLPARLVKITKSTQYILKRERKAHREKLRLHDFALSGNINSESPDVEKYYAQNYPEYKNYIRRPFKSVLIPEGNE